ncbi:hypothetical protein ABFT82_01940 [Pseudomonas anguilliseptica]|nr:hypothetical protein [Pseudomonas anguilliseptica]
MKAYRAAILHSIADPAVVGVEQSYGWSEKDFLILAKYPHSTRRVFR